MSGNAEKSAQQRAAEASISLAVAHARKKRAEAQAEYEKTTDKLYFTKDFNTSLEAMMRDRLATHGQRFLAWLKRYSWGEWSLFAIGLDGEPRTQQDAANELGIIKQRISAVVDYYEARGHLYRKGRKLYPVIAPVLTGPDPENPRKSQEYRTFLEKWKVLHSSDYARLEVARSTVREIGQVILSDYKKSPAYQTKRAASLLKIARQPPDGAAGSGSSSPWEESNKRAEQKEKEQQRQAQEAEMQFDARAFLFSEIQRIQKAYPKTAFAQPAIDRANPRHEQLLNLLVKKLGNEQDEEYFVGYVVWLAAELKGLGPGKRERKPGMSGGPESLGLLVNFAEDYARIVLGRRKSEAQGKVS